jgi:D-galactose 1-dehydrogenase
MAATKIALVGLGKIARDQHVPALLQNSSFELIATASPSERLEGVRSYPHLEALLRNVPEVEAVAICTPPQVRYDLACIALEHDCHVLLEKPPAANVSEGHILIELARQRGLALFAAWHSREAAGVEPARTWLAQRRLRRVQVQWKEDVRVWHPGQAWIWQAGGLGVFDPGINALSILTRVLPAPLLLRDAELEFPANCAAPIAARLRLAMRPETDIAMELDFLHTGSPPAWDIDVDTDGGQLRLSKGGRLMSIDGSTVVSAADLEYAGLYKRFAQLLLERRIDVDLAPLALVADAFLIGRRISVAPFVE